MDPSTLPKTHLSWHPKNIDFRSPNVDFGFPRNYPKPCLFPKPFGLQASREGLDEGSGAGRGCSRLWRQVGATRFGQGMAEGWPRGGRELAGSTHFHRFLNHFECVLAFILPFRFSSIGGLIFRSERPRNHPKIGPKLYVSMPMLTLAKTFKNCTPPMRKTNF